MKKCFILTLVLMMIVLQGCGNTPDDSISTSWQVNDIQGAIFRYDTINAKIQEVYKGFNDNLTVIQENYGEDYWDSAQFASLPEFGFNGAWTYDAYCFNEIDDINTIYETLADKFYRNKDGELTVKNLYVEKIDAHTYYEECNGYYAYFTYDPNHDWMDIKVYEKGNKANGYLCYTLEYARKGNGYILQDDYSRLYVELNEDKSVKNFYYTHLDGSNRKKYPATILRYNGVEEWKDYTIDKINPTKYNLTDTIFTHIADIDKNWVWSDDDNYADGYLFEIPTDLPDIEINELGNIVNEPDILVYKQEDIGKSCFDKKIIYENGNLVFEKYNALSKKIERYSISADGQVSKSIEDYMIKLPTITSAPEEPIQEETVTE